MKKAVLIIISLVLISIVFAATGVVNQFTTGNGKENLTFTGNSTQTLYIDVPRSVYVTSFSINITGYQRVT